MAIGVVQLAAERGHRLPHDRVAQPHQSLMLLEPQHPAARRVSSSTRAESNTSSMRSVRDPTVSVCRASPSQRGGGLRR